MTGDRRREIRAGSGARRRQTLQRHARGGGSAGPGRGPRSPEVSPSRQPREASGLTLFLRFADGCRHYLEDRGAISEEGSREIALYLEGAGAEPAMETIRKVYYVAYPGLEAVRKSMGRDSIFDPDVVRGFYAFDHNRRKHEQGNLICLAYPARVRKVFPARPAKPGKAGSAGETPAFEALLELEPVSGIFRLASDIPLSEGDWAIVHRMSVIERTTKEFADRMIIFLRKLGLDKTRSFPRKAFSYLTGLRESSRRRHLLSRARDTRRTKGDASR